MYLLAPRHTSRSNLQFLVSNFYPPIHPHEEFVISSVEILDYPARKRKIYRNFHFILPKFHFILPKFYFILPKFYFVAPWRIFFSSLEIPDFLGGKRLEGEMSWTLFMAHY